MGVDAAMDDVFLWGSAVAGLLLVLLLAWWGMRRSRRPAARRERADPAARHAGPTSRGASELDTVTDVHDLRTGQPTPEADTGLLAERQAAERAAEQAARDEADREAAEWEARLVAQQLAAEEEREQARREAELAAAAEAAAAAAAVPLAEAVAPALPDTDETPLEAQRDREAAEWEARLAAQHAADAEREAREAAAAEVAAEQAAAQAEAAAIAAAALQAQREAEDIAELERAARASADRAAAERAAAEAAAAEALAAAALAAVTPAPRTPEQCLVMIADDSKVVRVKTSRLLAKHLYRVSLAEDGLDAARQIEIDQPDVLITDVEMPGMDGFELTRQVRRNPRTAHIPIVMITADDVKHRADAAEAGVSVLMSKPYPEDELLSYLQSTLARSAHTDASRPEAQHLVG